MSRCMRERAEAFFVGSCQRKHRYSTRWKAVRAAYQMGRKYNEPTLAAYECRFCGKWHIGHPPKRQWKADSDPIAILSQPAPAKDSIDVLPKEWGELPQSDTESSFKMPTEKEWREGLGPNFNPNSPAPAKDTEEKR